MGMKCPMPGYQNHPSLREESIQSSSVLKERWVGEAFEERKIKKSVIMLNNVK